MVDVITKKCKHEGCTIVQKFNILGSKKGVFCREHKEPGMVDVIHKKCNHDGCTTVPTYNIPGSKKGVFCSVHSDKHTMVDVVRENCEHTGCLTKCKVYGLPGYFATRCRKHPMPGMMKISKS